MNAADFTRLETLFTRIVELPREARAAALDAECTAADRTLRAEVEALLEVHDRLPPDETVPPISDPSRVGPGAMAGPFRLLEEIGRGGMGTVYRAERADGAFTQAVAVKILRAGLDDDERQTRFRIERQILATLRHPNIVTLLDGGTLSDGQAFLAMELVDGVDIVRHCRESRMPLAGRLRMFATLCAAVQAAHQHGVVHRDLKPANILISSDGTLKVLDFGVAKLLQPSPGDPSATQGVIPGPLTPNYASPEQLLGMVVTTASDVYALGILLYELVADVRPYETQRLTLDQVIQRVVHQEPARPSSHPGKGTLRGDVDAIVLKAVSKAPEDRYASAGELGGDVARYLAGEPVLARGPSALYVLRRMAARNKAVVATAALALLAVVVTSGVALWQRQVAKREQARAEARFREVRQLANAMIFKVHDAVAPLAGSTPVRRTIVEDAIRYLESLEREAGANDVTLRLELAGAYRQIGAILGDPQRANLGDRAGAIQQHERARAIVLPLATESASYEVVQSLNRIDTSLTALYKLRNEPGRAGEIARGAVTRAEAYRRRNPADLRGLETLAAAAFNAAWAAPPGEQLPLWKRTLDHYEALMNAQPTSLEMQRNVALVEKYLAELLPMNEREPHFRRAVALDEGRLKRRPDDRQTQFDTAISIAGLARVLEANGDFAAAVGSLERSLELRRQVADSDPKDVQAQQLLGSVLADLARVIREQGDTGAARQHADEAIRILEGVAQRTGDRFAGGGRLAYAWLERGRVEAKGSAASRCYAFRRAHDLYAAGSDNTSALAVEAARHAADCR